MSDPLRVLGVEDNEDDFTLMTRVLAGDGLKFTATRVGDRLGLTRELNKPYDLIITDHVMPGLNAFTVLEMVRERGLSAPVIVVSGRIGEENAAEAVRLGAAEYVPKDRLALLAPRVRRALEHRSAEAALEQSRRHLVRAERLASLGVLAGGVAHQLNNPLTYIRLALDIASQGVGSASASEDSTTARRDLEEVAHQLGIAHRGLDRIDAILASLRRLTRGSSGGARQIEDASRLAEDLLTVVGTHVPDAVQLSKDFRTHRPIEANGAEITQVLLHLLLNATEAVRDVARPVIQLRTFDDGRNVCIEVKDNGKGIAPEHQARIFTPFFTTKPEGTGLGLSLGHRIVADHGGRLTFGSVEGRGTTFRIELPAAGPRATQPLFAPPPPPIEGRLKEQRITQA